MKRSQIIAFSCWFIALVSTLGSLFFSEVMQFPPCVLCWYQRIAMYPLVLIFTVGVFRRLEAIFDFATPLVSLGWFIALYHNLLHYGIIPESASPCLEGVSCSTVFINWLGFITIPMLSFTAFSILLVLLFALKRNLLNEK